MLEASEPSFAERARTLVHMRRVGALATRLADDGSPFGSVAPYGVDAGGQPVLLLSRLAVHTRNLLAEPRASLLVAEAERDDPLAAGRVTLVGTVAALPEAERGAARDDYLARHPDARQWIDFGDFALYRLTVARAWWVAGFGAMGWVEGEAYRATAPDPLAEHAAGILAHMNADHADALRLYCHAFGGLAAESATMTDIDRLGFGVRAAHGGTTHALRLAFPREVRTPAEARSVLVEMVRTARAPRPS